MKKPDHAALEAFLVVAREHSFTRAASKLNVSQSALSHAIRTLEENLGVRLLARTTRSVATTEAGERLFNAIGPKFEEIDADVLALGTLRARAAGTIRISCVEHAARTALWPRLEPFLRLNPEIQVEINIENGLVDIVAERFDAGIRHGDIVAKDMIALPIGRELRMAVVATPAYFEAHPQPKRPEELAHHRCINIRLPTRGNLYAWEFECRGKRVNVRVDGPVIVNSLDIRLRATLSGAGIAYLPQDIAAPYVAKGKLIQVLEEWCAPYSGYHLYYPSRRHPTPAFTALLEALRKNPVRAPD